MGFIVSLGFLELPLWGCLFLAFVPPALIALLGYRLSKKIEQKNDNLMTSLARFTGAALVFICAFLVGTLWTQTTAFLDGWRVEYRAAKELQRTADSLSGARGDAITSAVDDYLRAVKDTEVAPEQEWGAMWEGSDQASAALVKVHRTSERTAVDLPALDATDLRAADQKLLAARDQRFERSVRDGTPLVIFFVVLLLAWTAALCLSMYPMGSQRWVKVFQTCVIVVVIGLVQLPVYYLIGSAPMREFVYNLIPS